MSRLTWCGAILVMSALVPSQGPAPVSPQRPAAQEPTKAWVSTIGAPQYVAILVADADKSAEWYRTAFGLTELDRSAAEDGAWQIINLRNDHLFVEIIRDHRARAVDDARGFTKVGFHVPDVAVVADSIGRATGDRPRVIDSQRHGIRIVQIRDPDGNIIQLHSSLKV